MPSRRYKLVVANSDTDAELHLAFNIRVVAGVALMVLLFPVLVGLGAKWSARYEVAQLRAAADALTVENGNYRETTGELTAQIQSLEDVIEDLGARSAVDPAAARAMQKLPAIVKAKAAGGTLTPNAAVSNVLTTSLTSPEDTFGVLRTLLQALESRLRNVRADVERQEALAAATPSIWPAHGWLTGTFGGRSDPFTGEHGFHQGLDISTGQGQPVYATADGRVESASYSGDYGNLVVLQHEFGLATRYGHLSAFNVRPGDVVRRGDVVGYVGSTGRSTGSHLHYEVLANGKLMNPLKLLTQPAQR